MNWLNIHPFKNDKESALWVAVGTRSHKKPMNYQGIRIQLNKIAKRSGINKRCYPHLFRHGGAVNRLMKTGNLKSLQLLLGHSDQKMTLRYQSTMQTLQALQVESKVVFER